MTTVENRGVFCDACAVDKPAWRYSIPRGTPLMLSQGRQGEPDQLLLSDGAFGLCEGCREVWDRAGTTDWRSHLVAKRVVQVNPLLARGSAAHRAVYVTNMHTILRRILPLISDPVPHASRPGDGDTVWHEPGTYKGPVPDTLRGTPYFPQPPEPESPV